MSLLDMRIGGETSAIVPGTALYSRLHLCTQNKMLPCWLLCMQVLRLLKPRSEPLGEKAALHAH